MTTNGSTKRQLTFWIDADDAEALDRAAKAIGLSVAAVLRLLARDFSTGRVTLTIASDTQLGNGKGGGGNSSQES